MLLAWLGTGVVCILVVAAVLWSCHEWQRKHEAGRIVTALESEDEEELWMLLVEHTNFHTVREWFGETALNLAVKRSSSDRNQFVREAVRLFVSHGANINEPGTEWKTALMHAAANGNWDLCTSLLAYGADPAARDIGGRTAADWAECGGYIRIGSLLRKVQV